VRRRVFVIAGEYSANPRHLPPERRTRAFLSAPLPELSRDEVARLFFRFPNRGDDSRTRPEDWEKAFGIPEPVRSIDLFASAAHRALSSLHALRGGSYQATRDLITDLYVTSMPGLDPNETMNIGLVAQALRSLLALPRRTRAQFVVGTSDSGAWAFAQGVRAARTAERPATMLVVAGQILPSGYASQYQIRTVLGDEDQAAGLDMLAVGDVLMDTQRRCLGLDREQVQALIAKAAARKFQVGAGYLAGINAGKPFKRTQPRTPYFDASDIAVPCCGAAATILSTDEELIEAIAATRSPRFRTPPVTEVLGVGEGSSNETLIRRKSPLVFATSVREALADTADDAGLPLSTYPSCAFGVVHDAFPSIELSFLLAMGLGWERSTERITDGWSNPLGGLLTFGHALGASGLVQVNKAHHLFCVDQRYIVEQAGQRREGFRRDGALAFTTSVGGPLSHVVASILRGGYHHLRRLRERGILRPAERDVAPLSTAWRALRRDIRMSLPSYLRAVPGAAWIEGTTYVSIRSCLRALAPADIQRLTFDGLEEIIAPQHLEEMRGRLRSVVGLVAQESRRRAAMFDVFRLLAAEVRTRGLVQPQLSAASEGEVANRIKESLRAPLVLMCRSSGDDVRRDVRFLPFGAATEPSLRDVDLVAEETLRPQPAPPERLPFWSARAQRPPGRSDTRKAATPFELAERILEQAGGPATAQELEFIRTWLSPDPPRPVLQRALGALAPELASPEPAVRSVLYLGQLAETGDSFDEAAAYELFGRAAKRARGFLEAYESSVQQIGPILSVIAFDRPPLRARADDALLGASRFAHEVARSLLEQKAVVRAVILAGEGKLFEDVGGQTAVASPLVAQANARLTALGPMANGRPALLIAGASELLTALLRQRLVGWDAVPQASEDDDRATLWLLSV
jgi:hypothetical protein